MLGESAGRSAHNPTRKEARRRFEESERAKNTPLLDDPSYWGDEEFPNKVRMREWFTDVAASALIGVLALVLVLISKSTDWIGMVAGGVLVCLVCVITFWAYNMSRQLKR